MLHNHFRLRDSLQLEGLLLIACLLGALPAPCHVMSCHVVSCRVVAWHGRWLCRKANYAPTTIGWVLTEEIGKKQKTSYQIRKESALLSLSAERHVPLCLSLYSPQSSRQTLPSHFPDFGLPTAHLAVRSPLLGELPALASPPCISLFIDGDMYRCIHICIRKRAFRHVHIHIRIPFKCIQISTMHLHNSTHSRSRLANS